MNTPVGQLLVESGQLSAATADEILSAQKQATPFASLSYVLGYLDEEPLVRTLVRHHRDNPGVVLDRTIIPTRLLVTWPREMALKEQLLPIGDDEGLLYLATTHRYDVQNTAKQLAERLGKKPVLCTALHVTLLRTIRAAYAAYEAGDALYRGPLTTRTHEELVLVWGEERIVSGPREREPAAQQAQQVRLMDASGLDQVERAIERALEAAENTVAESVAVQPPAVKDEPPAIEPSREAEASDDIPIEVDGEWSVPSLVPSIQFVKAAPREAESPAEQSFEHALALYRDNDVGGAISALRMGLKANPLSARHHFVLANLLQKQKQYFDAIDEYEATLSLKPDYFPALTRLAYLYYRQGFPARAIESWRNALPLCPDAKLRQSIEEFMQQVIVEIRRAPVL